jgi:hypothetical protein
LQRAGWSLALEPGIGLAVKAPNPPEVPAAIEGLRAARLGWFLGFGDWCDAVELGRPPFLPTMANFCWTGRLAASREFTEAVVERGGAFAYAVASDDRRPSVIVVAPVERHDALESVFRSAVSAAAGIG